MPKPANLREFLKKEIHRGRVKPPSCNCRHCSSCLQSRTSRPRVRTNLNALRNQINVLIPKSEAKTAIDFAKRELDNVFADAEVDSLFGDPIDNSASQDQKLRAQLKQLITEGPPKSTSRFVTRSLVSTYLADLREEYKNIVTFEVETDLTDREWELIKRQKSPLMRAIRDMEEEESMISKVKLAEDNKSLPEPVDRFEKKRLRWDRERVDKAKKGLEIAIMKNNQQDLQKPWKRPPRVENPDHHLDGEERLRLGKPLKPPRLEITGHYQSSIHDNSSGLQRHHQ